MEKQKIKKPLILFLLIFIITIPARTASSDIIEELSGLDDPTSFGYQFLMTDFGYHYLLLYC